MNLPPDLEAERDELIAEIHAAFKGVSREGGVSWSETRVIDVGCDEDRAAARAGDTDRDWTDLVDDEDWNAVPGVGGFSFVDPIGFRYYLPAAMLRNMREGCMQDISHDVTLRETTKPNPLDVRIQRWQLERWAVLDDRQRRCVARFIRFMIAREETLASSYEATDWRAAYERYWKSVE